MKKVSSLAEWSLAYERIIFAFALIFSSSKKKGGLSPPILGVIEFSSVEPFQSDARAQAAVLLPPGIQDALPFRMIILVPIAMVVADRVPLLAILAWRVH